MLCWTFTIHNALSNIYCVGGIRCCAGGLPYIAHFQLYVVLEVNMLCWRFTKHNTLSTNVVYKSLTSRPS